MPRHRIRDIAALAGLSEATVDRVLHGRGTTRASSVDAVGAAVAELDRQQATTESGDRKLTIEAIVAADPLRARRVREALHDVRPRLRPRVVHTFVRTVPLGRPDLAATGLARVRSRRPQGVLIDLEDEPAVIEQAASLTRAGIPVVTTNWAFPAHASLGCSGLDNRAAGATAAYLIARSQPDIAYAVAHAEVMGPVQRERVAAFVATIDELHPGAGVTPVVLDAVASAELQQYGGLYVADDRAAETITSSGLREHLHRTATVVGHRDPDLRPEISTQAFDFALDVDWRAVVAEGCRAILDYHRRGLGQVVVTPTPPSVLTPYNLER